MVHKHRSSFSNNADRTGFSGQKGTFRWRNTPVFSPVTWSFLCIFFTIMIYREAPEYWWLIIVCAVVYTTAIIRYATRRPPKLA